MKRLITILAINEDASLFYKNQLETIFDNMYEVDYRNLEMEPIPPIIDSDLILYTDPEILNLLIEKIKCNVPMIMMKRTITRESLKKIKTIPPGNKVLVANINQYMANETVALIHQLGVTNLTLVPAYEGMSHMPEVDYIINVEPKKLSFLPDSEAKIIYLGHRVLDISNVLDILSFLRLDSDKSDEIVRNYIYKLPTPWYGAQYSWKNSNILNTQMDIILDNLSEGVIITNDLDEIEVVNEKTTDITNVSKDRIIGKNIKYLFGDDLSFDELYNKAEVNNELINYHGNNLVLTIKTVNFHDNYQGKVYMINPYSEVIQLQQKIHKEIVGKGHYSKYTFSKMIGQEPKFLEVKEICKKIAPLDSKILLLGDSGTGKEVFAGSIHNASKRQKMPFIAINCAAIPENLLESILFGYEEGAYTGAKKGGKIGLFEKANGGTMFLDEIGDLPLKLQARLLRVLEEGEIMRVGGDDIITVDVRIISATNKDLLELVKAGKFREDLFYRLSVFQIKIPSLSDRSSDIKYLVESMMNENNINRFITKDFKIFCASYSWPGNIRELKNVLEYMTAISDTVLSFEHLPMHLKKKEYYVDESHDGSILLLKLLYLLNEQKESRGRRTLKKMFSQTYYEISENEIRCLLSSLEEKEFIKINIGRGGNEITELGIRYLIENEFVDEYKN